MAISPMTARIGLRAEGRSIAFPYPGPLVAHGAAFVRVAAECRARPATGRDALRRMWDAMAPLYATAAEDPALPPELLSANWPGKAMRQSVAAASMALVPAVQAYRRELMPVAGA